MKERKTFNNTEGINVKNRIAAAISGELNKGSPIAVISMIVHMCAYEVDDLMKSVLAAEAEKVDEEK